MKKQLIRNCAISHISSLILVVVMAIPGLCLAGESGMIIKSEKKTYVDSTSGVKVTQLTDYKGNSHHFYFTNSGWYDNGRKLLFSSTRNNRTNLFGVDIKTGEIEQLTDLEPPPSSRELYFMLASKNPAREEVYFWYDLELMAVDLKSRKTRTLYTREPDWLWAMTNCSADGKYVYFGICKGVWLKRKNMSWTEKWLSKPPSKIIRVPVDGGPAQVVFKEDCWIEHVNTSPTQPNILTFCHEGPADKVDHRIWGLNADTGKVWKIRPTAKGESVTHEYWHADGIHIGYHGRSAQGKHILGKIRFDNNTEKTERGFPGNTGHIFSLDDQLIVGDGLGVIRVWKKEGEGYSRPRVLCRHDSKMRIQQTHPHPRLSPDGSYVVFTSDRSGGYGNVYMVPVVDFASLPLAKE